MISIIATTYNQARDLALYLKTLTLQTNQDFELVIADDGSREDTRAIIESFKQSHFGERLAHVWHEDLGYRKCKILNSAIRASRGQWLIFTDSDLILHPRFVEDHLAMRASHSMFMGRRVDLGPQASDWIREHESSLFTPAFYYQVGKSAFVGQQPTRGLKRAFRIEEPRIAQALGCGHVPDLLGSNFSIDRELLYRVNGFDESREHYWGEDGDLFIRVRNSGATITGRKSFAVQYHLWHKQRSPQPNAEAEYRSRLEDQKYVRCETGLNGATP
jgi:glycosyltransferase involved in cell wall biosynthesis